jgi:hypothetical protein
MDTLAELILERDKERGRRRSLTLRQGRVTRSQPKISQPIHIDRGKPAFRPSAALLLLGVVLKTTPSSLRLAYGQNSGFQCAHYLLMTQ